MTNPTTTLENLKAELAKARADQPRVHALGQRDHAAYIASLVRAIRREEDRLSLEFEALMLATMIADETYFDPDEAIDPIHIENYTQDLATWIEATKD